MHWNYSANIYTRFPLQLQVFYVMKNLIFWVLLLVMRYFVSINRVI